MKKKVIAMLMEATLFTLGTTLSVFAGEWKRDNVGWWYQRLDGSYPKKQWEWIDGNHDSVGECYYFDEDGYCLMDSITPDGYQVNENGAWVIDGIVQNLYFCYVDEQLAWQIGAVNRDGFYYLSEQSPEKISEYSGSSRLELNAQSQAIVDNFIKENITADMNDFEKEMKIILWMIGHISYDYEKYKLDPIPAEVANASDVLINGKAVCSGYSNVFKVLCDACGLNAITVSGDVKSINRTTGEESWERHAWNQICLDGDWYNVDVTWADSDNINSKITSLSYVNQTDNDFRHKHIADEGTAHECTNRRYGREVDLYLRYGHYMSDAERRAIYYYDAGTYSLCRVSEQNLKTKVKTKLNKISEEGYSSYRISLQFKEEINVESWLTDSFIRNELGVTGYININRYNNINRYVISTGPYFKKQEEERIAFLEKAKQR